MEVDHHYNRNQSEFNESIPSIRKKSIAKAEISIEDVPEPLIMDKNQDIYNMMAQSIVKKKHERQNLLELNKDKYEHSPYRNKLLKTRPPIIYYKNNNEQLFMLSEGERQVKAFSTSHYNVYGGKNRVLSQNNKIRQHSSQLEEFSFEGYKDVEELKILELQERLQQQPSVSQQDQFMDKPRIKEQSLFNQEQIEKEEKSLLRNALLLRKRHQANNGVISGSQSLMPGVSMHLHQHSFDITSQQKNITMNSVFGLYPKDKQYREQESSSLSKQSTSKLDQSEKPVFKRQRFSAVMQVDNTDTKQLQQKLNQLKQDTLKKMESFNIRPPSKWIKEKHVKDLRNQDSKMIQSQRVNQPSSTTLKNDPSNSRLNQSSLTTTNRQQINLKDALNKRSQTPLQNNVQMLDRGNTLQKPMTAGNNTLNNTHSNLIQSKAINAFQNRLFYESPVKVSNFNLNSDFSPIYSQKIENQQLDKSPIYSNYMFNNLFQNEDVSELSFYSPKSTMKQNQAQKQREINSQLTNLQYNGRQRGSTLVSSHQQLREKAIGGRNEMSNTSLIGQNSKLNSNRQNSNLRNINQNQIKRTSDSTRVLINRKQLINEFI